MIRVAVTGTDTGVGKTVTACMLVAALRARGLAVGAMKPVETGIIARDGTTDAERLRRAAGDADDLATVCPFTLSEPLAPWVAAERAGGAIDPVMTYRQSGYRRRKAEERPSTKGAAVSGIV